MQQTTSHLLMIEPTNFFCNPETLIDNQFQDNSSAGQVEDTTQKARQEFTELKKNLEAAGVKVSVYRDRENDNSPDSIFPNNWFSTHSGGELVLYPMKAPVRRKERRDDIINSLRSSHPTLLDLTAHEEHDRFLEGTGSLLLDRIQRQAYCALSQRSDVQLFQSWCGYLGFQAHAFSAKDPQETPVYHTNVIMAIGAEWCVICLESINDEEERDRIIDTLTCSDKEIIDISWEQVLSFCGNILEVQSQDGVVHVAMSANAWKGFTVAQRATLEKLGSPIVSDISTIERLGGGGVRCMLAEVFEPAAQ